MIAAMLLIVAAFYAGQLTAPEVVQTVTVPIKVPVPVPCQQTVPPRPAMPLEGLQRRPSVDEWMKHAIPEIEIRDAYEGQLRTRLQACTGPPPAND